MKRSKPKEVSAEVICPACEGTDFDANGSAIGTTAFATYVGNTTRRHRLSNDLPKPDVNRHPLKTDRY
jgi:hypothetical protein